MGSACSGGDVKAKAQRKKKGENTPVARGGSSQGAATLAHDSESERKSDTEQNSDLADSDTHTTSDSAASKADSVVHRVLTQTDALERTRTKGRDDSDDSDKDWDQDLDPNLDFEAYANRAEVGGDSKKKYPRKRRRAFSAHPDDLTEETLTRHQACLRHDETCSDRIKQRTQPRDSEDSLCAHASSEDEESTRTRTRSNVSATSSVVLHSSSTNITMQLNNREVDQEELDHIVAAGEEAARRRRERRMRRKSKQHPESPPNNEGTLTMQLVNTVTLPTIPENKGVHIPPSRNMPENKRQRQRRQTVHVTQTNKMQSQPPSQRRQTDGGTATKTPQARKRRWSLASLLCQNWLFTHISMSFQSCKKPPKGTVILSV